MRLHELTMPLDWEWMPDEVFPTGVHFLLAPRGHPAKGMVLGMETGTSLALPSQFADFRKTARLHEVPVDDLVLRETAIISLPRSDEEAIDAEAIESALQKAELRQGDALLVHTGWCGVHSESRGSDRYVLRSPHLTPEAAERLGRAMREIGSRLLLLDTAVVGLPAKHLIPQWGRMMPRPQPWPSDAAQGYLRGYTADRVREDFEADYKLAAADITVVRKLVNCQAIRANRVRVIVAPLHLVRGTGASCRVVALEE